ncbi:MAG: hypothetical protein H8E62_02535 [Planctomycetes bacterium]|nr:hypothetical protein [Planctomycetota bacterium]
MITMQTNTNYIPPVRMSYSAEASIGKDEFGATEKSLNRLQFGNTSYRFLQEISINSIRDYESGDWICWSSDLDPSIFGKGDTEVSSQEDFKNQIHVVFQQLYRKRPFEMNEREQQLWQRLCNVIDVYHYRTTTPIVVQEIGQVSYGKISRPYRIKWLTGYNYIIDPSQVPPELMSMKTGQYVEAVVKRDPVTHQELEIVSIKPISFRLPNEKEAKTMWDKMPAAELPEGGWD